MAAERGALASVGRVRDLPEPPSSTLPSPASLAPPPPSPELTSPQVDVGHDTPGAGRAFQRVGGMANVLVIMLTAAAVASAAALVVHVVIARRATDFLDGAISSSDFEDSYESLLSVAALPYGISIAIAVLTIVWMFRMARNVQALGRRGATWTPRWAIGGWFLPPFVVFAIPWLMLRELWRASDPANPPDDPGWKASPVPAILNVWWVLFNLWWILFGLVPLARLGGSWSLADRDRHAEVVDFAESLEDGVPLAALDAVVRIAAAAVFLLVVPTLTANHRRLTGEA